MHIMESMGCTYRRGRLRTFLKLNTHQTHCMNKTRIPANNYNYNNNSWLYVNNLQTTPAGNRFKGPFPGMGREWVAPSTMNYQQSDSQQPTLRAG